MSTSSGTSGTTSKKILIIEDEPDIVRGLSDALGFEGYDVAAAYTGKDGVRLARENPPDCVILDLMLPDGNGYEVCRDIRATARAVPIVILTARSQESDKIRGLEAGADDYVTKPFSVAELLARIRAIFRRLERFADVADIALGDVKIHFHTHVLVRGGESMPLSFYEVELLKLLWERRGEPVSRDEILDKIWGLKAGPTNRTVDNFIAKLRKKVERLPDKPEHILTVYGTGYKLAT